MNTQNRLNYRGMNGNTPSLPIRADESFVDYVCEARNMLLHKRQKKISTLGNKRLSENQISATHNHETVDRIREIIATDIALASFMRLKRSFQEIYKNRLIGSLNTQRKQWLQNLEKMEKVGPGKLVLNPQLSIPDYAKVEIHIQPGGYTEDELAGLFYDCGTQIFFGGDNAGDAYHHKLAKKTALPQDLTIDRVLEIGCSVGQLASELKKRIPNAEVWGTDISQPMLRYAHWRALQQNLELNFSQMASENLHFPDNHFDIVTAHLLFHEIPEPIIKKTLREVIRVLRPGGTFVLWDFPTSKKDNSGYGGLYGIMDAADNGEPYAPGFVNMGVEKYIKQAGFDIRYIGEPSRLHDRVCDKPF